jgi:hypothetical protein
MPVRIVKELNRTLEPRVGTRTRELSAKNEERKEHIARLETEVPI